VREGYWRAYPYLKKIADMGPKVYFAIEFLILVMIQASRLEG